jgi:hypothetical protein
MNCASAIAVVAPVTIKMISMCVPIILAPQEDVATARRMTRRPCIGSVVKQTSPCHAKSGRNKKSPVALHFVSELKLPAG